MTGWTVRTSGAELPVFEYGNPAARSTVLLVHGYPDNHHVFDPLIAELGNTVRVIAYDTRGSGASVLEPAADVAIEQLARDAFAVVESIPGLTGKVHVFAHDWGSVQMWEAMALPRATTAFASYTSVSGPSLDHLRQVARTRLVRPRRWPSLIGQLARSWYVFGFHVPVLGARVPGLLARLGAEGEPTPTVADQQRGIALYRANVLRRVLRGPAPRCAVPTTVVAPVRDRMLSPNLTDGLDRWIPDLRVVHVDAGHWWPYTHPADAARVLMTRVKATE
ncbi:alpha/beta fold hydrolase [Rhodococcoides yunnanense]|uniref:Alpha/beta fold hydrolase n=1 Tax=Rhodococcoides yunnanense TaxID=278209 RepID=A0ABU4B9N8_9NOCA|nr:alpha/beta fold hydrolase [Rhodococcus yunnanensis]MDV6260908.1 alpha/beta fold hydrolase [Rhodococcus yunnanensis]